ncbi:TauD/TfdA family dioxygenase [Paenibacillus sp. B01]|uniref:TauD/TfdA family dioxygenase n=1 Tax=Paenibacillus sp. B01 TaxID=2660554 RepID=UPI00129B5A51|nr:TauD/TfdA family dioxygenase [Paenibacillus sp. B01]QGG57899.1 hypothetical protein GE073_21560 [Paenibacillus sp. B01]
MLKISISELEKSGFIKMNIPDLSEEDLLGISKQIGAPVESRIGAKIIDRLSPKDKDEAHKNSLSGVHGMNSFPLHTDTAYFRTPARYILLYSVNPGSGDRPTLIYDTNHFLNQNKDLRFELSNVLYKVINGRYSVFNNPL